MHRALHGTVFLGVPVSRSRSPCRGRSLRSRRMRSALPNLDPAPARQDSAPATKAEQTSKAYAG